MQRARGGDREQEQEGSATSLGGDKPAVNPHVWQKESEEGVRGKRERESDDEKSEKSDAAKEAKVWCAHQVK